jgi:hypothetical protein
MIEAPESQFNPAAVYSDIKTGRIRLPYYTTVEPGDERMQSIARHYNLSPHALDDPIYTQRLGFISGRKEVMQTDWLHGYYIKDSKRRNGLKLMPDRIIYEDSKDSELYLSLYDQILHGNVSYDHFKNGKFGSVGFFPKLNGKVQPTICVKYFNLAYPFSQTRWDKLITTGNLDLQGWCLSSVTGVGSYMALRYLQERGLPTPNIHLATNDLLIEEYIPGLTIGEILDNYEILKSQGVLGHDDTIIDGITDFGFDRVPEIDKNVKNILQPYRHRYWGPDMDMFDLNIGNIMLPLNHLENPAENYYIIDPIR